jgi:carbamoyltransferase
MDYNNRINPLRGDYKKCTNKEQLLEPYFTRVAFDVQQETERVLVHLANDLKKKTRKKNLCIAGGVGLNSVSNKIILDKCDFEDIFIFPACSDAGIPLGLALWGYYNLEQIGAFKRKKFRWKHAYTGMEYSDNYIKRLFFQYAIPHSRMTLKETAKLISKGKIVGWYQGGSEYGPRALGHRSILADSRQAEMKDKINLRVKHREPFRPFAPSIIYESVSEYFDLDRESPYMLLISKVKKPKSIPSVTHVDNTARVQTVTKEANDIYYDLINEFGKQTGVPCVLNTSFNDAGEPIVETPEDAIICFLRTDMDFLVLDKYMIDATKLEKKRLLDQLLEDREAKIKTKRKELLEKYFKDYDEHQKTHYIAEMNKISEWYTKYKCKYELEKKVFEWTEQKRNILIVGTKSHTAILPKFINGFWSVNVVGFINYDGDAEDNDVMFDYKEYGWKDLYIIDFDEILVSSFEYNFKIKDLLKKKSIKQPVYTIYDNTSRDFLDVLTHFPEFRVK